MSKKTTYYCNICGNEIKNLNKLFGLHFESNNKFTLGGYGATNGIHICYNCARQLYELLNNDEIKKLIQPTHEKEI